MGNTTTIQKCNFEDIQNNLYNFKNNSSLLINTLGLNEQNCLIPNTIKYDSEEQIINNYMKTNTSIYIFIYGKNMNDETIYKKYNQLISLGFMNVYLYTGGLFEWLCLQDIFGFDNFPTTTKELDLLKYRALSYKKNNLLTN
jgi:hypothetical protein